jgi:hypothetical protein
MPLPNLTEDEHAELVRLVRDAIAGERYFLSPRMKRLKSMLAKLEPPSTEKPAMSYRAEATLTSLGQATRWLRDTALAL